MISDKKKKKKKPMGKPSSPKIKTVALTTNVGEN